jgi:hypothetical protein
MDRIDHNSDSVQQSLAGGRHRCFSLTIAIACICCGGQSGLHANVDGGGGTGVGMGTGGVGGSISLSWGVGGSMSRSDTGVAKGGADGGGLAQGGSGGLSEDASAANDGVLQSIDLQFEGNFTLLWRAIARGVHALGGCFPTADGGMGNGEIVFDGEGRVVDNTSIAGDPSVLSEWLSSLANERWPAYAGQTLVYSCESE